MENEERLKAKQKHHGHQKTDNQSYDSYDHDRPQHSVVGNSPLSRRKHRTRRSRSARRSRSTRRSRSARRSRGPVRSTSRTRRGGTSTPPSRITWAKRGSPTVHTAGPGTGGERGARGGGAGQRAPAVPGQRGDRGHRGDRGERREHAAGQDGGHGRGAGGEDGHHAERHAGGLSGLTGKIPSYVCCLLHAIYIILYLSAKQI